MDIKEYNQCVKTYSDVLYRFALQHVSDTAAAEDAVQDSFLQLWQHCDRIDVNQAKAYLFAVVRNQIIDLFRHKKIEQQYAEEVQTKGSSTAFSQQVEAKDALQKALAHLPDIQKDILLLREWDGFSYKEIADILNVSEQQVMVYLFRARVTMRKKLAEEGYSENNEPLKKSSHETEQ